MRLIWGVMRWGVWGANLNPTQVRSLIETGLENGITDYDHADIYGGYTTEALFGDALEGHSSLRDKLTLITKCGIAYPHNSQPQLKLKHYNTSGTYMRHRVEESLRFLRTDYIDRLLIHRPDVLLDGEEVAQTVEDLKKSGKIRSFGVSNFSPTKAEMLHQCTPLEEHQVEIHPLHLLPFEDGTLDQCQQHNWSPTAWSPLAGGKVLNPTTEREQRVAEALGRVGANYNLDRAQTAIAWLMKHPAGIRPILGTANASRLPGMIQAAETDLDIQDWYEVWSASTGENVP